MQGFISSIFIGEDEIFVRKRTKEKYVLDLKTHGKWKNWNVNLKQNLQISKGKMQMLSNLIKRAKKKWDH